MSVALVAVQMKRFALFLALLVLPVFSFAAASDALNYLVYSGPGSGQTAINYSGNSMPGRALVVQGAPTLVSDGSATLGLSRSASLINPAGNPLVVNATARVAGSAIAPLIKKAAGLLPVLGTGIAVYDLAKELGYALTKNGDGSVGVTYKDPSICTVAPCTGWVIDALGSYGPWTGNTPVQACVAAFSGYPGAVHWTFSYYGSSGYCFGDNNGFGVGPMFAVHQVSIPAQPSASSPATLQDFADKVASQSGWPTTSNIAPAVTQSMDVTGQQLVTSTPTVSGPATSAGSTVTTQNPDGTKSVTTTVYNHNYAGNTITTGATTTTTNYNVNNVVTSSSSVNTSAPNTDPCANSPTSAGCTDLGNTPTPDALDKKNQAVTVTPVSFAAGGGCPSPLATTFSVLGHSFGYSISYQPLCDRMALLRSLFIVLGAFVAAWILADSFKVT